MQFPTQSPNCPISSGDSGIELAPTSPGLSVDVDTRLETLLRNDAFEDVASANGYLTVHDYEPASANFKTPVLLTVVLTYTDLVLSDATLIQLRLNVGSKYIPTSVRPGSKSVLELHAVLSTDLLARSGRHISLSVHAYRNEKIFDSCDFGFLTALVDQGKASISGMILVTQVPSSHGNLRRVYPHASSQASLLRLRQFRRGVHSQKSIKEQEKHC